MHVHEKMMEQENLELSICCSLCAEFPDPTLLNGHLVCIMLVLTQGQRVERAENLVYWTNG